MDSLLGQTIAQYRILEKLGEGGMGVVYKAEDLKLTRIVALKFLPHALHTSEPERARFLQEARAAAILNHPNICTIHDIQEHDGQQFIVMEYVEGVTVKSKIENGRLRMEDGIRYALEIGEALKEAHSKGIVHRDVKAENIMVNARDQIKVMDFGLAKLKGSLKLTQTSSTVGTLAYMAPEQLHGGEIDARSDIFSFGVLLFEMFTGRLPFKGEHEAAIMYSIVNEPPESLLKYHPELPAELERIIDRALEKTPEDRYQHVDDLVSELRRLQKQTARVSRATLSGISVPDSPPPARTPETLTRGSTSPNRRRLYLTSAILLGIALILAAGYFLYFSPRRSIDSLAVLPFVNVSADPNTEYLSDGITETLINGLSRLTGVTVMSSSSVFRYKGKEIDPQKAGQELGVKAVLVGKLIQRGDELVISTELVDVSNNSHVWGNRYSRKLSDILPVQEEIATDISRNLSARLGVGQVQEMRKGSTENSEAYQLYLKGKFHWNKRNADDLRKAVDYFNRAIDIDPNYALAYAGLASTYMILPEYAAVPPKEVLPKIEAAAQKAIDLDPTLAETRAVFGLMKFQFEWDWAGAEKELKRAQELNPNYPTAYQWYSILLRQRGRVEESLAQVRKALELDPLSPVLAWNLAESYLVMQRDDEALETARKILEVDPNFPGARFIMGLIYADQGKFTEALSELKQLRQLVGEGHPYGLGMLGFVYARAGKNAEALKVLNRLLEMSKQGAVVSSEVALAYTGMGDKDKAFEWIDRAVEEHDQVIGYLKILPAWGSLRSDPRYMAALKNMGLDK
jgi:eukaryotic-like serine/threonine-protein kinase